MSERFTRVEQIFHESMELPDRERLAFVADRCAGDTHLRHEVESLLRYCHDTDVLNRHLAPVAATLLHPALSHPTIDPGTLLGPYRVERVLGEGGMGVVYLAVDTRLDRQVAIKTVGAPSVVSAAPGSELLREARAAAALAHPHIASLYDCGSTDGMPWFVMEYVTGVPLRTVFQPGGVAEGEIVRHATQIAAALEYAHGKGLVHRDIKPENILLTDDGVIKIIDFGLASAAQGSMSTATEPLPLLGTLRYMAPELLAGQPATTAADIYSVGVVLFEMATGEHPCARVPATELGAAIPAGFGAVEQRLPRGRLAPVVARCMARDPAARYRDGAELSAAIAGVSAGESVVADLSARHRLVILDFVSVSGGEGWLGTAIAETLATHVARLDSVRVATRRRVVEAMQGASERDLEPPAMSALGRRLDAQWVISGTYRQAGRRVTVTPTLIHVGTGVALPIDEVDGHLDAVFDLQDAVAGALLQALGITSGQREQPAAPPPATRSLLAYEHNARGRQRLYRMDAASLSEAIRHFERAVELDPGYAPAFSGLGTGYSLQFLRTSNPDDVARASAYLERATRLDPELGEPYPWLVNIRFRQNDLPGALEAGAKGVTLQPDLPEAHYFYGGINYMVAERPECDVRTAPGLLAESLRLQPLFHPAWIVLGATAMFLGQHATAAAILSASMAIEHEPSLAYRFVGAHTLRGIALARSGHWTAASAALEDALDVLDEPSHVYRDTFRALSSCALGDIALRTSTPERALSHYRHARRVIKDATRVAGSARLLVRADAGLAAAYAAAGDQTRGRQLADEAARQLDAVAAHTGTITFECGLGQLCLGLAVAERRLGRPDEAAALIARARACGWRDRVWLDLDPEVQPLHRHPAVADVLTALAMEPCPEVAVPTRPAAPSAADAS